MLPMKAIRLQLGILLAADATTLAPPADANKMHLIMADFALSENLTAAGLTFATFDGSPAIACPLGAQPVAVDPTTLQQLITIKDPLGAYRWVTTGATNLPQAIYGAALTDLAGTTLLGVVKFDEPISLTAIGQQIDLGKVDLVINPQPIS